MVPLILTIQKERLNYYFNQGENHGGDLSSIPPRKRTGGRRTRNKSRNDSKSGLGNGFVKMSAT